MKRLRIGVIDAGLIGQVEHIPNLVRAEYREPFLRAFNAFADACLAGAPVRYTVEHAMRDLRLLAAVAVRAAQS